MKSLTSYIKESFRDFDPVSEIKRIDDISMKQVISLMEDPFNYSENDDDIVISDGQSFIDITAPKAKYGEALVPATLDAVELEQVSINIELLDKKEIIREFCMKCPASLLFYRIPFEWGSRSNDGCPTQEDRERLAQEYLK